MTDPRTGLPSGRLIEEQLRGLMRRKDWTFILVGIEHLDVFNDAYGFVAGDEVLRFAALLFSDIVDDLGTANDFLGHASNDSFTIITFSNDVDDVVEHLRERFEEEVRPHYNFMDSERGGVALEDGSIGPLLTLNFGLVSGRDDMFADIREITELAAERRRMQRSHRPQPGP
jgi:GGDEF domain-containing protein